MVSDNGLVQGIRGSGAQRWVGGAGTGGRGRARSAGKWEGAGAGEKLAQARSERYRATPATEAALHPGVILQVTLPRDTLRAGWRNKHTRERHMRSAIARDWRDLAGS